MRRLRNAPREEVLIRPQTGRCDPSFDRLPRLFGDLKLDQPLGLPLHHNRAGCNMTALDHVVNAKPYQVTPSQLAVDSEVEQREFPSSVVQLRIRIAQISFSFSGGLLTEQLAFVPRYRTPCGRRGGIHERLLLLSKRRFMLMPSDGRLSTHSSRCA